ncbi:MAG: SDR family NAD(P)-dependent oxidoreductase [Moorea sp. SIO3G5]|nr:SDR family NAD(P)-dependent oxidoreductase [Moorena sp. SIO3G5]
MTSQSSEQLSSSKRLLLALRDAKTKLQAIEQANTEPIAIIGLGCRFPKSPNPDAFWQLLEQGIDAATEVPKERWDIEQYYDPNPDATGKMYTRFANFITDVDKFDPEFFRIYPREAKKLDPQHRLLLEVCWESLEYAGLSPLALRGSQTGVFIGMMTHDYGQLAANPADLHTASGNSSPLAAGRIAYTLGLQGPTLSVETACSSSLVACHLACQSLRQKECKMALVGGVNLMLTPGVSVIESRSQMNSPDGRCKTFDDSADGYGRGEGCGIVVLKRLSDAQADGDQILAIIRGSAVNHDGPSSGLTVPNGLAQEALIRQALANSKLEASQVDYVECHGTGTPLGDPIEVEALVNVYGKNRPQDLPIIISSVKTNIGHTEGAAGIAGLIKAILCLHNEKIPPHLHLKQPNKRIAWEKIPVVVPTKTRSWLRGDKTRLAGVSSFGLSGTNAHVIVEEAPPTTTVPNKIERPWHLLTLSAKTEPALQELLGQYEKYLNHHLESAIGDICYTANTGRAHFKHKLAVVASKQQELVEKLRQHQEGEEVAGIYLGELTNNTKAPKTAFLFTGQGSQYVNMGRQLYQQASTFREAIHQCDEILSAVETFQEKSLLEIIYPKDESSSWLLDQTAYTQPALFAIEYALFKLWQSWGIKPDAVMGHSVGEYVAACVAGVFSLEDGLKLIAHRGKLMQQLPYGGEMVSLLADHEQVKEAIAPLHDRVAIAAINGLESIVISGASEDIGVICDKLETEGIKTKRLQVSHPFHSPLMKPILPEFEAVANQITYHQPKVPIISNVTGVTADKSIATAKYWVNHVLEPVRFAQSMETLHQKGYEIFLEIGPKPILLGMGRQCLPEQVGVWLPSLREGVDQWQQMLSSLGQLYVQGVKVDWSGFDREYSRNKVVLPTYPFQRERYWIETSNLSKYQNTINESSSLVVNLLDRGDTEGLIQKLKLSEQLTEEEQKLLPKLLSILTNRHQDYLKNKSNIVGDYYDELASFLDEEAILNYIPLPGIIRGFSWVLFFAKLKTQDKYHKLASTAQQEIRNIGWQKVDFYSCQKVLDIGCGHGTDLMALGQNHNHLELCGYTISDRQVELGNEKINQLNLEQRIKIVNGDSSQDEFPDNYDLIYGFEVICHIKKKEELFFNIRNHLNNEGHLVLSDFISNASFSIDYDAHSSYLINQQEWLDLLSQNHLKIINYVDISNEVANGLDDPNFTENLNYVCKQSNLNENARVGLQSYDNLYKMLRKKLVSYVVMTAQKQNLLSVDEIYKWNQEILQKPLYYSDVSLQQLFYGVEWQKAGARQQHNKRLQPKNWIIFSDKDGVGKRLKNLLEKRGKRCFMVLIGETYKQKETGSWELNPSNPADFESFCQDVKITIGESLRIIHLWSLETTPSQQLTQSALESAQKYGCGSVLHLVQAMKKHWNLNSLSPQLWLITKGSQSVLPLEEVAIAQTPLWGLGKVISLEHPQLWGGLLDLDQELSTNEAEILQLLEDEQEEDRLAIRNGEIYVARLERKLLAESQPLSLSKEGSYLITGGTGALGLNIAQWLVQKGCQYLVLISRSQPSESAQLRINSLRKQGAEVIVTQADVSVQEDMEKALKQVEEAMPPLKGVIHAAGVVGFHLR